MNVSSRRPLVGPSPFRRVLFTISQVICARTWLMVSLLPQVVVFVIHIVLIPRNRLGLNSRRLVLRRIITIFRSPQHIRLIFSQMRSIIRVRFRVIRRQIILNRVRRLDLRPGRLRVCRRWDPQIRIRVR